MKVYLASNYHSHPVMRDIRDRLSEYGIEVTSRWIEGNHENLVEMVQKKGTYEKVNISSDPNESKRFAEEDLEDIDKAQILVFFSEDINPQRNRGGKHVEYGYALGKGKWVILVGSVKNVFQNINHLQVDTVDELVEVLKEAAKFCN